jgi:phosphate-selective porin
MHRGAVRLDFLARVQLDGRIQRREEGRGDVDENPGLDIARKRVGVRGRVTRAVAFEVDAELETRSPWRDVYVDYRQFRAVRVRAGRFKVPFSLDYTTSSTNLDFIDRSRAANRLAAGRDEGVMAHGRLWGERVKYEVGMFDDGRTTAMRLTGHALRKGDSPFGPLSAAVAFTSGTAAERLVESVWINGRHRRSGAELHWQPGPAAVTAEYMRLTSERRGQSVSGDDLTPLAMTGWYVAGTWPLLGASPATRQRFELAARIERLRVGDGSGEADASFSPRAPLVAGRAERGLTLGVNWFVMPRVKMQLNAVRTRTDATRARWTPLVRLQVSI